MMNTLMLALIFLLCPLMTEAKKHINLFDYTTPHHQWLRKIGLENEEEQPHAFIVVYAAERYEERGFNKSWTLEKVKIWAENFLLDMLINDYERMAQEIGFAKTRAEWAKQYKQNRNK